MSIPQWLDLVIRLCSIAWAIITTVILVAVRIRTIQKRKAVGEKVSFTDSFEEVALYAIDIIKKKEVAFNAITQNSGAKAGELKLDSVLNCIRDRCYDLGEVFDRSKWIDFVEKVVSIMNINKTVQSSEQENAVQSSEQETKFRYI